MENKKHLVRGIRTHDLTRHSLKSYPLDHKSLYEGIHGVFIIFMKKSKFLHKEGEKLVILKKNQYPKYGKNSLNTYVPRIFSP